MAYPAKQLKELLTETLSYKEMNKAIMEIQLLHPRIKAGEIIYSLIEIIYDTRDKRNNTETGQRDRTDG